MQEILTPVGDALVPRRKAFDFRAVLLRVCQRKGGNLASKPTGPRRAMIAGIGEWEFYGTWSTIRVGGIPGPNCVGMADCSETVDRSDSGPREAISIDENLGSPSIRNIALRKATRVAMINRTQRGRRQMVDHQSHNFALQAGSILQSLVLGHRLREPVFSCSSEVQIEQDR